jgi:hypothetical protein
MVVDDSFTHPARFAPTLIERIYDHALAQGWVAPGSTILDPFGGVGCGGIVAAYKGVAWLGVELEPTWVAIAERNFAQHAHKWKAAGLPMPRIVRGDSRELSEVIGAADCVVSSPPYSSISAAQNSKSVDRRKQWETYIAAGGGSSFEKFAAVQDKHSAGYGFSPGQLAGMKPGNVDAVISSPPYAESITGTNAQRESAGESRDKRRTEGGSLGQSQRHGGYGVSDGQLGGMKAGDVAAVVSSPPWESVEPYQDKNFRLSDGRKARPTGQGGYGSAAGQLGNARGPTFWEAACDIVAECYAILPVGGHAIWVTKDYVRNKARVPFTDDWCRLCESCGFRLVCRHEATQVKERRTAGLFGEHVKRTERKGFFRRIAERRGSPRIDHEDVTCWEKI